MSQLWCMLFVISTTCFCSTVTTCDSHLKYNVKVFICIISTLQHFFCEAECARIVFSTSCFAL